MAKVYVSSTYLDLQDYRRRVSLALRTMSHEDVAMEYYVAEDKRPVEKCLEDVAACEVYVGLFAWRYGWQPRKNNRAKLSITEMEYRQAVKAGKKCFIFLLDGKTSWPPDFVDENRTRIKKLRDELSEEHGPAFFTSPDDLAAKVTTALHKWAERHGQVTRVAAGLDLATYFAALWKRYQRLDLDALTPPQKEEYLQLQLRLVYVEQSVREEPPPVELPKEMWERLRREGEALPEDLPSGMTPEDVLRAREVYFEKPSRPVLNALTDERHRHSLVLGDPGSGKSTLARYVLMSLVNEEGDPKLRQAFPEHLPLLIELRTYAGLCAEGKCDTFLEFVEYLSETEGWGLDKGALDNHLKTDGRAVVIFDGLDEIFDPEDREQAARRIAGFANAYPKARVVVTSRVVGYRRKVLADAGFSHFTLQDLDEEQVTEFVDKWYALALSDRPDEAAARRERILRSFKESASIRQLAGNPMLLTIMAIIGKHQELPRERWKLYDHAASVLIQHWDINKHLKDRQLDADFIGEDDKKELLRRLAFKMQSGEGGLAGNYIHREQLQAEFETYLKERYALPPDRAKIIAEAMIQQFRERNFILSLYGANVYGFVHRAFLEFFCATAFTHKFEKTREVSLDDLKEVYSAHWEDRAWHEVLRLICGMIDEKFAGELIDHLSTHVYRPWPKEFGNRPPWNLVLAVQCLSEVKDINTVAESATRLLDAIWAFFSHVANDYGVLSFISDHVLPAVGSVGVSWPRRALLLKWLEESKPRTGTSSYTLGMYRGRLIGIICGGMGEPYRELLSLANHDNAVHRITSLFALQQGWHDEPRTVQTLSLLANKDPYWVIRALSVSVLTQYFNRAPETFPLVRDAIADEHDQVRWIALSSLAKHFPSAGETLPLLRERAENDPTLSVRQRAKELANELEEAARPG